MGCGKAWARQLVEVVVVALELRRVEHQRLPALVLLRTTPRRHLGDRPKKKTKKTKKKTKKTKKKNTKWTWT
jgi:hypothetical protein